MTSKPGRCAVRLNGLSLEPEFQPRQRSVQQCHVLLMSPFDLGLFLAMFPLSLSLLPHLFCFGRLGGLPFSLTRSTGGKRTVVALPFPNMAICAVGGKDEFTTHLRMVKEFVAF